MGRRIDVKIAFQNSIWSCNLCQSQIPSHRLKDFGYSKGKVKRVCRNVLVLCYMYLKPVKKSEPFSCGMRWDVGILKISLYPLHSSFIKTLGGLVINAGVLKLPLLDFLDRKPQKSMLVNFEREFIRAILGSSKWQRGLEPGFESAQHRVSNQPALGTEAAGPPWPSLQDTA